jgi:gliding motility-associated-like protein
MLVKEGILIEMRKIHFLHLIFLYSSIHSIAQPGKWSWAVGDSGNLSNGNSGMCVGLGTAVDSQGNIYAIGYFQGTETSFGNFVLHSANVTLYGNASDIYLVKYDSSGNVLWAKSFGGTSIDVGNAVAIDPDDNVYITGQFISPSIVFGSNTLSNPDYNSNVETSEYFLAKLDSDGNVLWARTASGTAVDKGEALAVDNLGNVYVQGFYMSTVLKFDLITIDGNGQGNVFLAKYDTDGNLIWVKGLLVSGFNDSLGGGGIALSENDGLCITGTFLGESFLADNILVKPQVINPIQRGDIYLIKYDFDGKVLWAKSFGGNDADSSTGVTRDKYGMVYISGWFISDTLSFGNAMVFNPRQMYGNDTDIFIAKFDAAGNPLWAKSARGTDHDLSYAITCNKSGNIFITGTFHTQGIEGEYSTFGDLTFAAIGQGENNFIAEYDSSGKAIWIDVVSINAWNQSHDLAADRFDNIVITGVGAVYSFGGYQLPLQASMFLARLHPCHNPQFLTNAPAELCQGNSLELTSVSETNNLWSTGSTQQTITVNEAGNYILSIQGENRCPNIISNYPVIVNPIPEATISADSNSFCEGNSVTLTCNDAFKYVWNSGQTTQSIDVNYPGTFAVTIIDKNGCSDISEPIEILENRLPNKIELLSDCNRLFIKDNTLVEWFYNGINIGSYAQEISPTDSGLYFAESTNICGTIRSKSIYFKPPDPNLLFIPNVITPNNDSFNEYFVLDEKLNESSLLVVDRWGKEVFFSDSYKNDWSGNGLSSGIYYFRIRHHCFQQEIKGFIQIIK